MALIDYIPRSIRNHLLTTAFFFGFIVDNFTLNRVDQVFDNVVLAFYVVLAMCSLLVLYASVARKLPRFLEKKTESVRSWAPLVVQYALGGLMSGILIFYSRSGDWFSSWPFLLIIIGVIASNEFIKDRASKLTVNLTALFIGLFAYVALVVPVLFDTIGAAIFVASGVVSLVLMGFYIRALQSIVPKFMNIHMDKITFSIGVTFFVLNGLYFLNVIPPIPLSIKEVGIFHNVERVSAAEYILTYEEPTWWEFFKKSDTTFRKRPGDKAFCYSSVFAPTGLSTTIFHRFEYYDENANAWVTNSHVPYVIDGGRDEGFRGYSFAENIFPGRWRCSVETKRGQIIGRDVFRIVDADGELGLITRHN